MPTTTQVLAQVYAAVRDWRTLALSPEVGLLAKELDDFAPTFEYAQMDAARGLIG
ncbi:hypothetical protein MIZ03_1467 [Rhodoferax lithotrophicus]|uniref:Uncharacterized protein n=1 Tax=Rhodoferax lithotrophicus TaxID=2798804 RepID=A0ABM7MK08_9BURK|nr:hypothetical protein MIZ03_1467 [Rhodoferax sp. MIZ03]